MLKKGKLVLTLVLLLLFSFIYINQYPTRYPFQDDWIIGKSREEILERYEDQRLIDNGEKYISYMSSKEFSFGGKNWWSHNDLGMDNYYVYTILLDESGKAIGIKYWSYG